MKIRKGFVSNSSSSSFVAWGVPLKKIDFSDSLYLKRFDSDFEYYKKVVEKNSNCSNWMKEMYKTMLECKTDNEKITWGEGFPLDQPPYQLMVRTWNDDDFYPHTVLLRFAMIAEEIPPPPELPIVGQFQLSDLEGLL